MECVYLLTVCNIFEILKCTKIKGLKTNEYYKQNEVTESFESSHK